MSRLAYDFIGGSLDDGAGTANLTDTQTDMDSPALAALPTIASPDYLPITLNPDGLDLGQASPAPEVVWITAHTASATTATIARGKQGTTATDHPDGTDWNAGVYAADMAPLYSDYTPVIIQAVTVSTSFLAARYTVIGNQVHAWGRAVVSSAGTGNNTITVDLPVAPHADHAAVYSNLGTGTVEDNGTLHIPALVVVESLTGAGTMRFIKTNADSAGAIGAAGHNFALASGDKLAWNLTYEAA